MLHIYQQIYLIKNLFIQNSPSCFGSDGSNRLALGQSPPLQAQPVQVDKIKPYHFKRFQISPSSSLNYISKCPFSTMMLGK